MSMSVLEFWNSRAKLKAQAGSDDIFAKELEIETIAKYFRDNIDVAEFGCGSGVTALEIARRFDVRIDAYDYSPEMIKEANDLAVAFDFSERVNFYVADITNPPKIAKKYDIIFTERMIINLPNWTAQLAAIKILITYLKPGGRLLLVENSATGLEELNKLRVAAGLHVIEKPWHNVYLDDATLAAVDIPGCKLIELVPYSATYYFLSRVVNAWLAKREGRNPSYDSPVNQLAQYLPAMGDCAQGKLWVWERTE